MDDILYCLGCIVNRSANFRCELPPYKQSIVKIITKHDLDTRFMYYIREETVILFESANNDLKTLSLLITKPNWYGYVPTTSKL